MARLTLNGMIEYDGTLFDGMILPDDYDRAAVYMEILNRCGQMYPYHQIPSVLKSSIRLWFARNFLQFDRIMEALNAEYNPVENYDRHEAWTRTPNLNDTQTRTGSDTTSHTGSDTETHTGQDSTALSGKDTVANSGTDTTERTYDEYKETVTNTGSKTTEEEVSAFDSSSYEPSKKTTETPSDLNSEKSITGSYADGTTHGKQEDTTYGKTETLTRGTTDTQQFNSSEATTYGTTFSDSHTGKEEYTSYIHGNIGVRSAQELITQSLELSKYDVYIDIAERFEREFMVQVY